MESRIEELKQKYWKGQTTQAEEVELKAYYATSGDQDAEANYFLALVRVRENQTIKEYPHPAMKTMRRWWIGIAASFIVIAATVSAIVLKPKPVEDPFLVEDPEEAYILTRNALMMMSSGLNEGKVAATELKRINKAEEILIKN